MAILIVSDENLRTLKSILMSEYELRSAHASEGIAALCGFGTYAALQNFKRSKPELTAVELDFRKFEKRMQRFGYDDKYSLDYLRMEFRYIYFPNKPWLMLLNKQISLKDDYFYECQDKNIPFITIIKKRKYCELAWDCISTDPKTYDAHIRGSNGDRLVTEMYKIFQLICSGNDNKALFDGAAFCGKVTRLTESSARQLANAFFLQLSPSPT